MPRRSVRNPVHLRSSSRFLVLALAACNGSKKQPETQQPDPVAKVDSVSNGSGKDMVVQPRFSGGQEAPSDEGRIPFTITKVDANQKPSATAPFHEAGGDWTYVEAQL